MKTYRPRGPLQLYRTGQNTAFVCSRCTQAKVSKLVATIRDKQGELICNACHGYLLSVWSIRAGQQGEAERDDALTHLLGEAVSAAGVERGRALLQARDARATTLSSSAQKTLATAEAVGAGMVTWTPTDLDWSAAIVCLCKAVEIEVLRLIVEPLRLAVQEVDLSADRNLDRMVAYCEGRQGAHMELGSFVWFLTNVTGSRASTGPLAQNLRNISRRWPRSDWIFEADGLRASLRMLVADFRNKAAHTEILGKAEFDACSDLVSGSQGLLWRLIVATMPR